MRFNFTSLKNMEPGHWKKPEKDLLPVIWEVRKDRCQETMTTVYLFIGSILIIAFFYNFTELIQKHTTKTNFLHDTLLLCIIFLIFYLWSYIFMKCYMYLFSRSKYRVVKAIVLDNYIDYTYDCLPENISIPKYNLIKQKDYHPYKKELKPGEDYIYSKIQVTTHGHEMTVLVSWLYSSFIRPGDYIYLLSHKCFRNRTITVIGMQPNSETI